MQWPRAAPVVGNGAISDKRRSVVWNLSNYCQMACPLLFCSRKLWKFALGLSEEGQCSQGAILKCARWSLIRTLSEQQVFSSVNLVVDLRARFAALNQSINESRSSENRLGLLPQVQATVQHPSLRFFILTINNRL